MVAIIAGILVGVIGFLPLVFGMNKARNASPTSNLGHAGALLLGVLLSFIVLGAGMVICLAAFREYALPFVLAEAGALVAAAVVFGVSKQLRK